MRHAKANTEGMSETGVENQPKHNYTLTVFTRVDDAFADQVRAFLNGDAETANINMDTLRIEQVASKIMSNGGRVTVTVRDENVGDDVKTSYFLDLVDFAFNGDFDSAYFDMLSHLIGAHSLDAKGMTLGTVRDDTATIRKGASQMAQLRLDRDEYGEMSLKPDDFI